MRNTLFISALLFALTFLSACKKDWVCTCVYNGPMGETIGQLHINVSNQYSARAICNYYAEHLAGQQVITEKWVCSL